MTDSVFLHVHVTAGRHINMFYWKKRKLTILVVFENTCERMVDLLKIYMENTFYGVF